ncbi:MAG: NAD(P)-dependent oxidoreductase [Syntrophales bacterium]|jgi:nucleoside-diphosphate-sugar epimerase
MEVLIVGGAGDVGRYLAKVLPPKGHKLTILDQAPPPLWFNENLTLTYLQGNISDATITKDAVRGKDLVIHLAWSFANDPYTIFDTDIKGHTHLLEAASSSGVKGFIYTSTATVYGRAVVHPVTEAHQCLIGEARKPLYALGKLTAEELCKYYHKTRGLHVTIFRFWWAFGDSIGGSHLRDLIRKAIKNEPLELVRGAGGAFITMADLESAILLAASRPIASGQTYNLGSFFLTWEEIVKIIVHLTNSNSPIQFIPSEQWRGPAFLSEVWDLDWSKATTELGFRPTASAKMTLSLFTEAIKTCIINVQKDALQK